MNSPVDGLSRLGVRLTSSREGTYKTTCPKCSSGRRNKKERCLSVKIDNHGFVVNCHHCGWSEGEYNDGTQSVSREMVRKPGDQRGERNRYENLLRMAARGWRK